MALFTPLLESTGNMQCLQLVVFGGQTSQQLWLITWESFINIQAAMFSSVKEKISLHIHKPHDKKIIMVSYYQADADSFVGVWRKAI